MRFSLSSVERRRQRELIVSFLPRRTDHFYPALQWLLEKDISWMKSYTSKVFFVGENDWTGQVRPASFPLSLSLVDVR